jgi:hypothetical protein
MEVIMSTSKSTASEHVTAFVTPLTNKKFVCIVNNKTIAKSNDETYFERHYVHNRIQKLADVDVDKFVYLTPTGRVDHVDIVSKSNNLIARMVSKFTKSELVEIRKEARSVISQVREMKGHLA